jgi:hypothetical protein
VEYMYLKRKGQITETTHAHIDTLIRRESPLQPRTYLKQKPMKETRASAVICPTWTNRPPKAETMKIEK